VDVAGKRVFVVGGSMGIGLAAAKRFAAGGAHVAIFARRRGPLDEARTGVRSRRGATRASASRRVRSTCGTPHRVTGVLGELIAAHGAPDVLLNCAGRAYPKRFEEITAGASPTRCRRTSTAAAYRQRRRPRDEGAGGGYVVNTASLAGLIGVFGRYTDYCASKFAVVGFSEALRSELKPHGIMVSVLCPPDVDTARLRGREHDEAARDGRDLAGAKVMTPDEVAAELFAGMARRAPLIIPGRDARMSALAKRPRARRRRAHDGSRDRARAALSRRLRRRLRRRGLRRTPAGGDSGRWRRARAVGEEPEVPQLLITRIRRRALSYGGGTSASSAPNTASSCVGLRMARYGVPSVTSRRTIECRSSARSSARRARPGCGR
jgi:short-subunit dehydrogenase